LTRGKSTQENSPVAQNAPPPPGTVGVVLDIPFTRGFVVIGEQSFPARAAEGEIESSRHVRVVGHDGDELVVAALAPEEAAAIEAELKQQVLATPVGAEEKLFCPRCSADTVAESGSPSPLDGKMSYKCSSCNLEMGPFRSRFVLWLLTAVALLLAIGSLALFTYDRLWDEGKASLGLLLAPPVGGAFFAAGLRELSKPVPRRW
jgi:hypothetical protein